MSVSRAPNAAALPGLPARYEIERLLGSGRQKRVFLARDASLDRQVAIAAIGTSGPDFPDVARLQEARTMARLGDHPHVTSIYDVIESPGALYIVSRYVSGGDLQSLLRARGERPLPLGQAIRIAAQVCRALEHVHERGIAHRDVKPSNIFLDERGNAVLGDFGLALARAGAAATVNEFVGTPAYVAPEQVFGSAGPHSDLYSLGCVLFELTTGSPPFCGRDGYETIQLHLHSEVSSMRTRNPAIPPALDDLIVSLLAKDPGRRPGASRDVRAALEGVLAAAWSVAAQGEAAGAGEVPDIRARPGRDAQRLVGRDEEYGQLRRLATQAASGVPGVLFLEGEAGVGKSRLLREFRTDAEDRGAIVLIGHAYQDAPVPYRPIVEALLPLAGRLSGIDPHDADLVRRLLYLDHATDAASEVVAEKTGRQRLVAALFHALVEFCRSRPIILVFEDLHWADSASLDLIEHLILSLGARATRAEVKLAIVGSLRPVEPDHRLGGLLGRLRGEVISETRHLAGLSRPAVYHALRGLGIERPSDQLAHTVHRVTEGNPLFIGEVVSHLRRRGALQEQRGFTVSTLESTDIAMPTSMTAVITDRIRDLSVTCHEALVLGAFLGPGFALTALASLTDEPSPALATRLQEAVGAGLLVEDNQAYRFIHPLVRQALYQEPRAAERQRIHCRIADHLEQQRAATQEGAAIEIAHHLTRAGVEADAGRLARAAARAADGAMQSFAWHEAATLLEAAIAAAARGAALLPAELAELHRRAGIAYFNRFDAGPCVDHLDRAVALFGATEDVAGAARALNDRALVALQLGLVGLGEMQPLGALEAALEQLGNTHRSLRARILATLSESHWMAQDAGQAVVLAERAMALAREDRNDCLCADISVQLSLAHMQHLEVEEALASYEDGIAFARRANHLSGLEQCLQRQAVILCMNGRFHDAERAAGEARDLNEVVRSAVDASWTAYLMVNLAALRGDHDAVERHGAAGIELLRRGSYPWSGAALLSALAYGRAMRDDAAGANQAIDLLLEPGLLFDDVQPIAVFAQPLRALTRAYGGEPVDPTVLQGAPPMEVSDAGFDFSMLPFLAAWVELGALCDPPQPPPQLVAALALADERGIAFAAGWPFLLPRILGVAAAATQRWHDAERYFERAIGLARGVGAKPELLRAQIEYAQALVQRAETGDIAKARRLLGQAAPRLAGCCPQLVLDKAASLGLGLRDHVN